MRRRSTRCSLARDPGFDATAFRSSHDGLPEPLCAIYEPRARAAIAAHIAAGRNCPRKFLINAHTQLLEQPNPRALDNVNTVDEYERGHVGAQHMPERATPREIRVQYYALLREQAGRSDETLHTGARDAARVVRRAARAISVHAAAGDAARGHQRRIRRVVAAA